MENKKLELVFSVEKDTKNTRRYKEEATDGPPVIPVCHRQACLPQAGLPVADRGTLYVQQWALRKLNNGSMPGRVRVTVTVDE